MPLAMTVITIASSLRSERKHTRIRHSSLLCGSWPPPRTSHQEQTSPGSVLGDAARTAHPPPSLARTVARHGLHGHGLAGGTCREDGLSPRASARQLLWREPCLPGVGAPSPAPNLQGPCGLFSRVAFLVRLQHWLYVYPYRAWRESDRLATGSMRSSAWQAEAGRAEPRRGSSSLAARKYEFRSHHGRRCEFRSHAVRH